MKIRNFAKHNTFILKCFHIENYVVRIICNQMTIDEGTGQADIVLDFEIIDSSIESYSIG